MKAHEGARRFYLHKISLRNMGTQYQAAAIIFG